MKLDKSKMLQQVATLGGKLRCQPNNFASMEGKPDHSVTTVRLNRLGKCIEMMTYLMMQCSDGQELDKNEQLHYDEFIRYLKECHSAFEIGKKP